jgi:ATP-dependent Lon protease
MSQHLEVESIISYFTIKEYRFISWVVIPITVGRDKSIQAVKAAFGKDKLIGVVSQNGREY